MPDQPAGEAGTANGPQPLGQSDTFRLAKSRPASSSPLIAASRPPVLARRCANPSSFDVVMCRAACRTSTTWMKPLKLVAGAMDCRDRKERSRLLGLAGIAVRNEIAIAQPEPALQRPGVDEIGLHLDHDPRPVAMEPLPLLGAVQLRFLESNVTEPGEEQRQRRQSFRRRQQIDIGESPQAGDPHRGDGAITGPFTGITGRPAASLTICRASRRSTRLKPTAF